VGLLDLDGVGNERVEAWRSRPGNSADDLADVERILDDLAWGRNVRHLWYTVADYSGILAVYTRGSVVLLVDYQTGDPRTFSIRFVGDEDEMGEARDPFG
jgi:hypothetical protein